MAEPDFFHLIGNSMVDKFSKVKHPGVIIGREFSGILDGGADGVGCRHPNRLPASPTFSIPGSGAKWDGAGSPGDGWRGAQAGCRRYARISGGVGAPGG